MILLAALIAGGIYFGNTPAPPLACGDFNELSDYVSKNIQQPDSQNAMTMNPAVITSFRWKRNKREPFVTYPIIKGVEAIYGWQDDFRSNDFIVSAIKNNSNRIDQTINEKAQEMGLIADSLNTLPLQTFSDKSVLRVLAFRKKDDIYEIVLKADWGHQVAGRGEVTVTCGKKLSDYDRVYNALNLKIEPAVENHYADDYVAISDVSFDHKVYALIGSSNHIHIAEYYYFDGNSLKLVTKDSYPADCAPLESQKVGKGMRCRGSDQKQQTVSY